MGWGKWNKTILFITLGLTSKGLYFCPFCLVTQNDLKPGIVHSPVVYPRYHMKAPAERTFEARTYQNISAKAKQYHDGGCIKQNAKV